MTEGINPLGFLESKIDTEITLLKQIATSLGNAPLTTVNGFSMPFQFVQIDLTVVNTQKVINCPVNPVNWIQAISDGALDGITLWLDNPGTTAISLKDLPTIQTNGTTLKQVYLTSDVRSGRSYLRLYFSQTTDPLEFNFGGQDISLSETAVRGGSIDFFDRRGTIMFQEDFSNGLQRWTDFSTGVGGCATVSADRVYNKQVSCKLTTGNLATNISDIQITIPYPTLNVHGLELSFTYNANISNYWFTIYFYDGTNVRYCRFLFTPPSSLSILTPSGTVLITNSQLLNPTYFNTMKIVADIANGYYKRLIFNNNVYNISQYQTYLAANANAPGLVIDLQTVSGAGGNQVIYVANVIVTRNEP